MENQHRSLTTAYIHYPFKFHHNLFINTTSQQTKQTMDTISEIVSLIHHGCNLARDLESNLPNLANQPENMFSILKSLDEIMRVFGAARERLHGSSDSVHHDPMSSYVHVAQQQQQIEASLQEWLSSVRCNYSQAMDQDHNIPLSDMRDSGAEVIEGQIHRAMDHIVTVVASHDVNAASSSQSRPRRRKDHGEIHKLTVPAPRIGNTEIPPEDGFTWRKYGQKDIMGSRFPRGYYRCTHQKLYSCPAKKQVQRLDHDPLTFEVVYRGDHTCHMSSTAPSTLPPPPPPPPDQIKEENTTPTHAAETSQPFGSWLSMDFTTRGEGSSGGGGGENVGTSTTTTTSRYGKEIEFPVADLADAMFNSGSSSSNSMDFIFTSPVENKWESADKKI